MKTAAALLASALMFAVPMTVGPALAQDDPLPSTAYKLHEMNFDMWCQEQKHYAPERCDKRLPKDDAEFKAYRRTIETYELQRLKQERQDQEFDRDILHNDPIDNPSGPSADVPGAPPTPR